jgi:hypothetical protein
MLKSKEQGSVYYLESVSPATYAVSTHPLPGSLGGTPVIYGHAAFDGAGNLWLLAEWAGGPKQNLSFLVRYTPASGALTQFPDPGGCPAGGDIANDISHGLSTASDGSVWAACTDTSTDAYPFRLSPDGGATLAKIVNNAPPGTELNLAYQELPGSGPGWPLAAGAGGTMWGAAGGGEFVQLTAGGRETLTLVNNGIADIEILGNGTGTIETLATCIINNSTGEHSEQCVNDVQPDGTETTIARAPDYDGYNDSGFVHWAAMDKAGNVWVIMDHTSGGTGPQGQYYWEVSPGGATKTYPFTVPGDAQNVPIFQSTPPITPDGGLWTVDTGTGTGLGPNDGALIEIIPKS